MFKKTGNLKDPIDMTPVDRSFGVSQDFNYSTKEGVG